MRKLSSSRFLTNTSWLIGGRIAQMLISFFIGTITTRYLGPSNYGVINYVMSYCTFFLAFCTLGLNSVIVKRLVDHPDQHGEIVGTTIGLRLISSLLSTLCILFLMRIIHPNDPIYLIVAVIQSGYLILQAFEMIDFWYQQQLRSKRTATIRIMAYIITAVYRVYILVFQKDVTWFAFANTLDLLIVSALFIWYYRKDSGTTLSFSWPTGKEMLQTSRHFIWSSLMVAIYGQMDRIMLRNMMDDAAVGYYSAATYVSSLWTFVLAALIDSARPLIMETRKTDYSLYIRRNRQLYAVLIWLSAAVSVGFTVLAKPIMLILYGESFLPSIPIFRIVTWFTAFSYLGVARSIWLVSEGFERYEKHLATIGTISNLILNGLLIPRMGGIGAALASLLTQFISNVAAPLIITDTRPNGVMILQAFCLKDVLPNKQTEKG